MDTFDNNANIIKMDLAKALNLWVEVTNVDPSKKTGWTMGDLGILRLHEVLKEALLLDDTLITGHMLFEYVFSQYMQERTFTAVELLEEPDRVRSYLDKCRLLVDYLRSDEMVEMGDFFSAKIINALNAYGVQTSAATALAKSPHLIALLRRDSMRSIEHLEVHQFLDGQAEPDDVKPVYGKYIYKWANINSMLNAMTHAPSGITVNLITDPTKQFWSYFVFCIRNGGNLFVFTDREDMPHPLAQDLMRRPDKILANRAERNWFPYELMGLAFDDEGRAYIEQSKSTDLVLNQTKVLPIKAISELEPSCIVWLTMMFDLIIDKFWRQEYKAPALSYTGEMIKVATPLIDAAKAANLPVTTYQTLAVGALTVTDIRSNKVEASDVGEKGAEGERTDGWIEARYAHLVRDDAMNLVSRSDVKHVKLLEGSKEFGSVKVIESKERVPFGSLEVAEYEQRRVRVDSLDASSFGTAEQLEKDRRFIARSNFAKEIERLAELEFEQRHEEILAWVRERISANIDNLRPYFGLEELIVPGIDLESHGRGAYGWRNGTKRKLMERRSMTSDNSSLAKNLYYYLGPHRVVFLGAYKRDIPTCFISGAPASWAVQFIPETAEDLAFLCGCAIKDLPDVLQHWTMIEYTTGNHILSRVDPMAWQCANPWRAMHFKTTFLLSAREMNKMIKETGRAAPSYPPK